MKNIRAGKKKKASFPVCKSRWGNTWAVSCPGSGNSQHRSLFAVFQIFTSLVYDWIGRMDSEATIKGIEILFILSRTVFPITYSRCFSSCGLGYISHMYFIHSCTEKEWKGALQSFNPVSNPWARNSCSGVAEKQISSVLVSESQCLPDDWSTAWSPCYETAASRVACSTWLVQSLPTYQGGNFVECWQRIQLVYAFTERHLRKG